MKVNNPGKKDLDQLVMLEQETFPEAEAASRESIERRRTNNSRYKWHYY